MGSTEISPELSLLRLVDEFHSLNLDAAAALRRGYVDMARARCAAGTKHAFGSRYVPDSITPAVTLRRERRGDDDLGEVGGPWRRYEGKDAGDARGTKKETKNILRKRRGTGGAPTPSSKISEENEQKSLAQQQQTALLFGSLAPRALKRSGETFASSIDTFIALANLKLKIQKILEINDNNKTKK